MTKSQIFTENKTCFYCNTIFHKKDFPRIFHRMITCSSKDCKQKHHNRTAQKKYRGTDKNKISQKVWNDKNREKIRELNRVWGKNNYNKIKQYRSNPRIKRLYDIRSRDSHRYKDLKQVCEECRTKNNLQIHHLDYDNSIIKVLCGKCHVEEHKRLKCKIQN